jgi:glycosyltransferase involved in cell wall biosynthesis
VRFSPTSVWDETNPWRNARDCVVDEDAAVDFDVVFLSGTDWRRVIPEHERPEYSRPILNLIQHVRHADPADPLGRHMLLRHKAIRICVSAEVERAIAATGRVHGPVFTIPDAIDVAEVERLAAAPERDVQVLVAANKQPDLGAAVAETLRAAGAKVELVTTRIPRAQLLGLMGRAQVTVLVPNPTEGFYLPAIEGMAAGTLVVCPDCVGTRSYCVDGVNCLNPPYEKDEIVAAAKRALDLDPQRVSAVREQALATARAHDLAVEREAFLAILDKAEELWAQA